MITPDRERDNGPNRSGGKTNIQSFLGWVEKNEAQNYLMPIQKDTGGLKRFLKKHHRGWGEALQGPEGSTTTVKELVRSARFGKRGAKRWDCVTQHPGRGAGPEGPAPHTGVTRRGRRGSRSAAQAARLENSQEKGWMC